MVESMYMISGLAIICWLYVMYNCLHNYFRPSEPSGCTASKKLKKTLSKDGRKEASNSERQIRKYAKQLGINNLRIYYSEAVDGNGWASRYYGENRIILCMSHVMTKDILLQNFKILDESFIINDGYFIPCHELGHLSNNNELYFRILNILALSIFYAVMGYYQILYLSVIWLIIQTLLCIYIHRIFEKQADMTAIKMIGSPQGGIEHMKQCQNNNKNNAKFPISMFVRNNGDYLLDISHPSLSTRISYMTLS